MKLGWIVFSITTLFVNFLIMFASASFFWYAQTATETSRIFLREWVRENVEVHIECEHAVLNHKHNGIFGEVK